jgi:uncharacterized membrane protein (UPF0127 family)
MILTCARNNIEIAKDAKLCIGFFDRLLGLINPENPRNLVFCTHFGIHTFFLVKSIDVIVLDRYDTVRVLRESLGPYRFCFYNPLYSKVIELPRNTIRRVHLSLGDKILFA